MQRQKLPRASPGGMREILVLASEAGLIWTLVVLRVSSSLHKPHSLFFSSHALFAAPSQWRSLYSWMKSKNALFPSTFPVLVTNISFRAGMVQPSPSPLVDDRSPLLLAAESSLLPDLGERRLCPDCCHREQASYPVYSRRSFLCRPLTYCSLTIKDDLAKPLFSTVPCSR